MPCFKRKARLHRCVHTDMKIEFIKEGNGIDIPTYYTTVNGLFVSGSLSSDEEKARQNYEKIVKNKGVLDHKEVLHQTIIDNSKPTADENK